MRIGDLVRYTDDGDIGIVIKVYETSRLVQFEKTQEKVPCMAAIVQWIGDLSVDYFDDYNWDLLEVIGGDK